MDLEQVEITDAWIALIGTIFGGVGLKAVEAWLNRGKVRQEKEQVFRDDLMEHIEQARRDLATERAGYDEYRNKYFDLYEKYIQVMADLAVANRRLEKAGEKPIKPPNLLDEE